MKKLGLISKGFVNTEYNFPINIIVDNGNKMS